jgi:ubiquinone/menaquinone biosynthesis C-methylase UbiE
MDKPDQSNFDAAQAASAAQFEKQSDRYGKSHILADTSDVAEALGSMKPGAGDRALDVATGGGHTALRLASMGWSVTAGDISPKMLDGAKALAAGEGLAIETRLFPAEAIPFGEGEFALVSCRVAPHHFSSPEKFVQEAARVLRTGGHFLLIDGSVPDDDPESEEWLHRVEKWRDPSHGRFLSRRQWESIIRPAGFEILESSLQPRKQPDLNWYFDTAATSPENRIRVLDAVRAASPKVRGALRLADEDGRITWWWPMVRILAVRA